MFFWSLDTQCSTSLHLTPTLVSSICLKYENRDYFGQEKYATTMNIHMRFRSCFMTNMSIVSNVYRSIEVIITMENLVLNTIEDT